jgi:tripartite-type tricarboxylate transporter receptor subunit TctC
MKKRQALALFLAAVFSPLALAAEPSAAYPSKSVRLVVGYPPGGAGDIFGRLVANYLSQNMGQQFVVENRPGAAGTIAAAQVARMPADGYALYLASAGDFTTARSSFGDRLPYSPERDFTHITLLVKVPLVLVAHPSVPAANVQEFIAWARKQTKGVFFGSAGVGTTPHLAGDLFKVRAGITATHVPYRGAAQSMPALMACDTDFAIDNIASYMPLIKAGKVRALAVTAGDRWPTLPDVPTMQEAGVKNFLITSWGAFVLPKGTPAPILNKLSAAITAIAAEPAMQQRFLDTGARTIATTPAETYAFAEKERVKWKEVVQISGAKMD